MSETFEIARKNMVLNQLRPNKINEENILNIFENTPKENYLDVGLGKNCYLDNNLDNEDKMRDIYSGLSRARGHLIIVSNQQSINYLKELYAN